MVHPVGLAGSSARPPEFGDTVTNGNVCFIATHCHVTRNLPMSYRILLSAFLVTGFLCSESSAFQWGRLFQRNHAPQNAPHRVEPPIPHYGYGYVVDPYFRGTFEIPDPLTEPFFQTQHKFDSHFPGRYTPADRERYRRENLKTFQR